VSILPLLVLLFLGSEQAAPQSTPSFFGIVRQIGTGGAPIAGAEVLIGSQEATTDRQGRFSFERIQPGNYPVRVRRIGYRPMRSRISVKVRPTEVEFQMTPAPALLPTLEVVAQRTGIYGVVGDSLFRPIVGAKVSVLGLRGGDVRTDSLGRFAFPNAGAATYLIHVEQPGYTERQMVVELPQGSGRELSFRLVPDSERRAVPGSAAALWELRRRLAMQPRNTRMTPGEIQRFGSLRLCDVPKIRSLAGDPATVILNGVTVLREVSLCSWRMDEIALVEFCSLGPCFNPDSPRPLRYPDPSGRRRPGGAIIVWEKR
jgi:hypothetical protein